MKPKQWLVLAGMLAGAAAIMPAQAAPSGVSGLKGAFGEESSNTLVRHRCYRHRGHWHCPRHARHYHRYYDEPYYYRSYRRPYPYYYGGYGPGFGLYFGGHRGWRGHW